MKHNHGEKWELIDIEARNVFKCCTPRMIKYITGVNTDGDRIRKIDKCNTTAVFLSCFENENWDYFIKSCKNKDNREEWGKDLRNNI